jgi:hypothetical protein
MGMSKEPRAGLLPSAAEMMEWISAVVRQGIRRPGYPADAWTERWAAARLAEFGLDVRLEPVDVPAWYPEAASVRAWPDADPGRAVEVAAFALPYTAPTAVVRAPLAREPGEGRLVLDEVAFARIPQSLVRDLATAAYDPEGVFDTLVQTVPMAWPSPVDGLERATAAGAAGYVGALTGVPWETRDYYVPYDAVPRPLPAVWVSPSDSRALLALLDDGPCTAEVSVAATTATVRTHNVVATLPGGSAAPVSAAPSSRATGHRHDASAHGVLGRPAHSAWSISALAAFSWSMMCSGVSPRASDMETTALRLPSSVTPLRVM